MSPAATDPMDDWPGGDYATFDQRDDEPEACCCCKHADTVEDDVCRACWLKCQGDGSCLLSDLLLAGRAA